MLSGTIGHYRLGNKIGEGGMGEVYAATDTKLGREVAVKVLPERVAEDPDRMARFSLEARLLAALNHPNIASIYGVEDRALIMELVDGPTLAERIARAPLGPAEALPIIEQIVDALEYAHDKGIIHRDLKPANIKLTADGRVKILDFGLAKAFRAEGEGSDPLNSPTLTIGSSTAGLIMGTAAYMSPEQARGREADRRADIWSFGVVVYEMLTGCRLFDGETVSDTLAAVLREEPDWSLVPEQFRRLVRACLMKDPRRRMRDIGDARLLLDDRPATREAAPPRSRWMPWAAAAVLCLALASAALWFWRSPRGAQAPALWLDLDLGPNAAPGRDITAVLSPDGSKVVYPVRDGSRRELAIRSLESPNASMVLPGTVGGINPFFSPRGDWVGFFAEGKLKKVSVRGGAPVSLCDAPGGRGGSWGEDEFIVFAIVMPFGSAPTGLLRVPEGGGTPEKLTDVDQTGDVTHRWPQVLNGGQAVLFTASNSNVGFQGAHLDVFSLKTRQRKTVQQGAYFGRVVPSGHLLFVRDYTIFAAPFDLRRLEPTGPAVPVIQDVSSNVQFGGGQFSCSDNGSVVYLSGIPTGQPKWPLTWIDRSGRAENTLQPATYVFPRLSPDRKRIAVGKVEEGQWDVWVADLDSGRESRITFMGSQIFGLNWAPDGRHLVFAGMAGKRWSTYWVDANGGSRPEPLFEIDRPLVVGPAVSPDGRFLLVSVAAEGSDEIWAYPLDHTDAQHPKAGAPKAILVGPEVKVTPAVSPDGAWIAYSAGPASTSPQTNQIFVQRFDPSAPTGGGKWQVSTEGGLYPVWSPKGRRLFYWEPLTLRVMFVEYTVEGRSFRPGTPRPFAEVPMGRSGPSFDVWEDGNRIIGVPGEMKGDARMRLTLALNWFDELRRRAPVR